MPKIMKYRKLTDKYTTYTAVDNGEEDKRITELCTIDGDTYISVPDDLTLPEQPKEITLKSVTLTTELKKQIEEKSPHTKLIKKRMMKRIRERYSTEKEIGIIRNFLNKTDTGEFYTYNTYIAGCIEDSKTEEEKLLKQVI